MSPSSGEIKLGCAGTNRVLYLSAPVRNIRNTDLLSSTSRFTPLICGVPEGDPGVVESRHVYA